MAESDAKSLSGALADINQCPICLEPLNQPKLLACGHSFCFTCLESYYTTRCPAGIIVCSMDRSQHKLPPGGIAELPSDHRSTQAIEILQKHRKSKNVPVLPKCVFCKSPADYYCINCSITLCINCSSGKHETSKSYADHLVLLINKKNIKALTCSDHNNQFKTDFCSDCGCLTCKACILSDHDTHQITPLADVNKDDTEIGKMMKDVQSFLKNVDSEYNRISYCKGDAERNLIQIKKEINQYVDKLIASLQAKRGSLVAEAEMNFKQYETYHSSVLESLSNAKDHVKRIETKLKRYTKVVPMNPNIAPKTIDVSGLQQNIEALKMPQVTLPTKTWEFIPGSPDLDVGKLSVGGQSCKPSSVAPAQTVPKPFLPSHHQDRYVSHASRVIPKEIPNIDFERKDRDSYECFSSFRTLTPAEIQLRIKLHKLY